MSESRHRTNPRPPNGKGAKPAKPSPGEPGTGTRPYRPLQIDIPALAGKAYDRLQKQQPGLFRNASPYQRARAREDLRDHLVVLRESLAAGSPALLADYARRAQVFFSVRHLPPGYVSAGFAALRDVLRADLPEDIRRDADAILRKGIASVKGDPAIPVSCIDDGAPLAGEAHALLAALTGGDLPAARRIVDDAVAAGTSVEDICLCLFQPVLAEAGRLWLIQHLGVAEEHVITAFIDAEIGRLRETALRTSGPASGSHEKTVVAASVEGDRHGIGIRIVSDFFGMEGWTAYYTGPDTPAASLLRLVRARRAAVVALSCTMVSHLPALYYLIRALRADPETAHVKIVVGGYPFSVARGLWRQIGADAYARDAREAVAAAERLVAGSRAKGSRSPRPSRG